MQNNIGIRPSVPPFLFRYFNSDDSSKCVVMRLTSSVVPIQDLSERIRSPGVIGSQYRLGGTCPGSQLRINTGDSSVLLTKLSNLCD